MMVRRRNRRSRKDKRVVIRSQQSVSPSSMTPKAHVRVPFKFDFSLFFNTSGTMQTIKVDTQGTSGFMPRISVMAPLYEFYRFVQLEFEIQPWANSLETINSGLPLIFAYMPQEAGVTDITTAAQAQSAQCHTILSSLKTVTTKLKVPRKLLLDSPQRWFSTNSSATKYEVTQGNIHVIPAQGSILANIYFTVKGVVEFYGYTPSAGADIVKQLKVVETNARLPVEGS